MTNEQHSSTFNLMTNRFIVSSCLCKSLQIEESAKKPTVNVTHEIKTNLRQQLKVTRGETADLATLCPFISKNFIILICRHQFSHLSFKKQIKILQRSYRVVYGKYSQHS